MWKPPNTETFFWDSHIYKPQFCAHTIHSQCQTFKAKLTFTQPEQRYKQNNSSCLLPSALLQLPQENCECISPKTSAAKAGHKSWAGEPQAPQTHLSQALLSSPLPSAAAWRALVPQEALRLFMLGQEKSQNKTESDCQLRTRAYCRRNGNNSL